MFVIATTKNKGTCMKKNIVISVGAVLVLFAAFIFAIVVSNWMIADRVPVRLLESRMVIGDKMFAMAKGTIVTVGERDAMPLQTSVIECQAARMECQIARALIIPDKFMIAELGTFQVIEWTESHLVFEEKTSCVINTFALNWITKTGTGIRTRLSKPEPGVDCSAFIVDDLRTELRNGPDVWAEEEIRAYPLFIKLLTSIF
jgi:hypothetical protein